MALYNPTLSLWERLDLTFRMLTVGECYFTP